MAELTDRLRDLARARARHAAARKALTTARRRWECENHALYEAVEDAGVALTEADHHVRRVALEAYRATGDKHPATGVGIRVMTRLEYSDVDALTWAADHRMALQLDRGAFERIAKATPLAFVAVYEEPVATVAKDLSKSLEEEV